MVTYTQFAERLARGQLKNTAAVESTNLGEIVPDYADTIRNLTNQGLVDITTRLPVIKRLVDLTFVDDQFVYPMVVAGAYLSTTGLDTFVDEQFVKVLDVYDADGKRYQPNSGGHITTPVYNSLRFTAAYMDDDTGLGPTVRVQYQAKHLEIIEANDDDEILIPPNMIQALQLFVASQYITDMGGKDNIARGDSYYAMYLRAVSDDIVNNASGISEVEEDTRFDDQGFV